MKKYIVKFYKSDYMYIYLKSKEDKKKFLTFGEFVSYIETNNIDFKSVKFDMNLSDLFYHFVDYNSVKKVISYSLFEEEKKKRLEVKNNV